jgi:hypothetical protein
MSTRIGTLEQKKRFKMWPIVAALVAVTAVAAYLTLKPADRDSTRKPVAVAQTFSGTAANTPTELRGGIIGGVEQAAPNDQIGRRNVTPRVGAVAVPTGGIEQTVHSQLNQATGDDPTSTPQRPEGPIGFHPLP